MLTQCHQNNAVIAALEGSHSSTSWVSMILSEIFGERCRREIATSAVGLKKCVSIAYTRSDQQIGCERCCYPLITICLELHNFQWFYRRRQWCEIVKSELRSWNNCQHLRRISSAAILKIFDFQFWAQWPSFSSCHKRLSLQLKRAHFVHLIDDELGNHFAPSTSFLVVANQIELLL